MQTICKEQLGLIKHFHRPNGDIIKIVLLDSKSMLSVLLTERSFLLFIALQFIRISPPTLVAFEANYNNAQWDMLLIVVLQSWLANKHLIGKKKKKKINNVH